MLRTIDLVLVGAMIAAATVTYQIKHAAEEKLAQVQELQAEIRLQEETIDLLEADWSLLNQPSRLQRLSTAYEAQLGLKPIEPTQMADRMYREAADLLSHVGGRDAYRLIGVGLSDIVAASAADLTPDLLDPDAKRRAGAERAADAIRARFGADAIVKGRALR